jgi:hypothetical protein
MPTTDTDRIAELEQEVRDLKRQIHGTYPEPDHDGQGGRPSWVVNRDLASVENHQMMSGY